MFVASKMICIPIFLSLTILLAPSSHAVERVLYYDTFEEYDTRDGGFILPEGVERTRTSGRLFSTEREIEAPSAAGDTRSLARYITDPSGLSLVALLLQDDDDDIGDGSLGADGSVSLIEAILLDQGDHAGRAVISWKAIPYQDNETGGTMFPETDSTIDAGPEGINLVGFGGITREFDTGLPIPGQDFSKQIIINREGAVLNPAGVSYEANVPSFFVLDFDLEASTYDLIINGVLAQDDLPFFDIQGETGKTLRELELISNARGIGTFVYDDLFQLDPDYEYAPVPFRTPLIADQAELIPLFIEQFEDNDLGALPENGSGDLFGSEYSIAGSLETVEDSSWQSPARGKLSTESTYTLNFPAQRDNTDPVRASFVFTPSAGSTLKFAVNDVYIAGFSVPEGVSVYQDAVNDEAFTGDAVYEGLPHWVTVTLDTQSGLFFIKMYRATAPDNAQTAVIEAQGALPVTEISSITLGADDNDVWIDEVLVVEVNQTPPDLNDELFGHLLYGKDNTYQAFKHSTYEERSDGEITTADSSKWSFQSIALTENETMQLHSDSGQEAAFTLNRSARFSWTAIPAQSNGPTGIFQFGNRIITGLLPDGTVGIGQEDGSLISSGFPALVGSRVNFVVVFDFYSFKYRLFVNENELAMGGFSSRFSSSILNPEGSQFTSGSPLLLDDVLVVQDHYGAKFSGIEFVPPVAFNSGVNVLFEEDFENNPARSELAVNEFTPRNSGLPIPTNTRGFSDLAETDIAGTRLMTGAPSADAAYIEDPGGSSLYSLFISDPLAPQMFAGFATALPFTPISTLRTTPYAFVVPQLAAAPQQRYVTIRWSGRAKQNDQAGLALFAAVQDTDVPVAGRNITIPAPVGSPVAAFGEDGTFWFDLDGDGAAESSNISYQANHTYRFIVHIDTQTNTYDVSINEQTAANDVPLSGDTGSAGFLTRFGWFTTLVNDGNGVELQQSTTGGGKFVIDDIRVYESNEFTAIEQYKLYE